MPVALIVGAQRCGTTSLYRSLRHHPQILAPVQKELHFFDLNFANGQEWYRKHFPLEASLIRSQAITMEASPSYMFHPHALRRIKLTIPEVRIIVLLRNPVNRAISHYFHEVQKGREPLGILDALAQEESRLAGELDRLLLDESYQSFARQHYSYRARGEYADQLERCLELFGRENVHIIQSEVMFKSPKPVLIEVLDFLDLPRNLPDAAVWRSNAGAYRKEDVADEVYRDLADYFAPHNRRLYDLLGEDFDW